MRGTTLIDIRAAGWEESAPTALREDAQPRAWTGLYRIAGVAALTVAAVIPRVAYSADRVQRL